MTGRQSAATTGLAPGLDYFGQDERGWHVFSVDAQLSEDGNGDSPRKIFRVALPGKVLELVQQDVQMTVYVNPEPCVGRAAWDHPGKVRTEGRALVACSHGCGKRSCTMILITVVIINVLVVVVVAVWVIVVAVVVVYITMIWTGEHTRDQSN